MVVIIKSCTILQSPQLISASQLHPHHTGTNNLCVKVHVIVIDTKVRITPFSTYHTHTHTHTHMYCTDTMSHMLGSYPHKQEITSICNQIAQNHTTFQSQTSIVPALLAPPAQLEYHMMVTKCNKQKVTCVSIYG